MRNGTWSHWIVIFFWVDRKSKLADTTEVKKKFFSKIINAQYLNQLSDTRSGDPLVLRFPNFIPIGKKTWSPWAILVSDWLKKIFSSETRKHNEFFLCSTVWCMGDPVQNFHSYFMSIRQLIWLPLAVLVCDYPIKKNL